MKNLARSSAMFLLAIAIPLSSQAHKKQDGMDMSRCEMSSADTSKLSAEDRQKMIDQCAAQKQAKDCDMGGMDMSSMSPEDHQKMMASCQSGSPAAAPKGGS
jgi:hypothetical protein